MSLPERKIEWTRVSFGDWQLYLAKSSEGLCYISTPGQRFEDFSAKISKKFKEHELIEDHQALKPYVRELQEYFNGTSRTLSLPIDAKGTPFQQQIWQALQEIPYGTTVSYSEIAQRINRPTAVRAVGAAIGANPVLITVPCHRVIGKNGTMTGFRAGIDFKQFLLALEQEKVL
ncbi:methylated-DNA--[protein]-cysteine S-methyltransferase [Planococcus sp. X10-3]|uniref:methylated-DNA--[protein]-cysteine S-methyltransferase n=1 Tax=Planococcus sp. X10-3 TaxID=3061240 RepID=UPI003BAE1F1F